MAAHFVETSALVKRYVLENGTSWVRSLTDPEHADSHFPARISLVEVVSANTRRERGGSISPVDATTALADLSLDFSRQYRIIEVSRAVVDRAATIARNHGLRGYDAVQLAAALVTRDFEPSLVLVSADRELNAAAMAEGFVVENPEDHP